MSSGDSGDDPGPIRPAPKPVAVKKKGGQDSGASGDPNCSIIEQTKINSPDPTVRATLREKDVLSLDYDAGPPKRLLAKTEAGAILGSITSSSMPQLIRCILAGYEYDVIILSIKGGLVDVQIQPR